MAVGANAHVGSDYGTAVGTGATIAASSPNAVALGAGATVQANAANSTALGSGAMVQAGVQNAVALGANSVASESNTVSVGASGSERRITNVAAGVNPTDAVNVAQLNGLITGVEQQFSTMNKRINMAYGGVAMGMASNVAPLSLNVGEKGLSGGIATYQGQAALGFRFQAQQTQHLSYGVNLGVTTGGNVGAAAGVGFKF